MHVDLLHNGGEYFQVKVGTDVIVNKMSDSYMGFHFLSSLFQFLSNLQHTYQYLHNFAN